MASFQDKKNEMRFMESIQGGFDAFEIENRGANKACIISVSFCISQGANEACIICF